VRRIVVLSSLVAVVCAAAAAAVPSSSLLPLPWSKFPPWERGGKVAPLRRGVTYQANRSFPIALRLTPPDESWSGAQWKTSAHGFFSKKPPFFGWIDAAQAPTQGAEPLGAIVMVTSYTRTRSATATATYLRTRGHGATYEATSHVTVAGFFGLQFDGTIVAKEHAFIPFTPQSRSARFYGDAFYLGKGAVFRIIVLQVRTKTVVLFISNEGLPPDQFPAFLAKADNLLQSLKFPR
jgi:hypothetical protein